MLKLTRLQLHFQHPARTIWAAGSSTFFFFFFLKNQPQKEFKTLRLIDTVIQLSDM